MPKPPVPFVRRLLRHLLLWLLFWFVFRYIFIDHILESNWFKTMLAGASFVQVIAVFYLFGYYVLPQYLYRFRFVPLVLVCLLTYQCMYLTNYATGWYLHDFSHDTSQRLNIYTRYGWALMQSAGWLGCFTNLDVVALTFGHSFFFVSLPLTGKVIQDLLTSRTRTLLAERDAVDLERSNLTLERENLTLELDMLKAQVNPHFLFNALNSIYARVVDVNDPAADLVLRLAELMRYNLYEADVDHIALTDEIAYIDNYLGLEKTRHADLIDVIFSADDDFSGYQIAPLILIAFVENAFKHGLGIGLAPAYVMVDAQVQDDTFYFTVQNSVHLERRVVTDKRSGGVGLANVKKRLDLLYADRYRLDVSQTNTRYTVSLELRLDVIR